MSHLLTSPPFLASYPAVLHHDLIPPEILAKMQPAWRQRWFPARHVTQTIYENAFVAAEGLVFTSSLEPVPAGIGQHTPAQIEQARAHIMATRDVKRHAGTLVLCKKSGAHHYGHWLLELLPRAYFARADGPARYLLHAVPAPLRTIMRQSLACLGITPDVCIESGTDPISVERLLIVDGLAAHGSYISPLVMQCMQAIAGRIAPASPCKLFLTRPRAAGRYLLQQDRYAALAARRNYRVIDPGKLSFAEQVAHFSAADEIIGVAGSALSGTAFAKPGARVTNIVPATMPDTFYWFISNLRGLHYTEIRCATRSDHQSERQHVTAHDDDLTLQPGDVRVMFGRSRPAASSDPDWPELRADLHPLFEPDYYTAQAEGAAGSIAELLEHYDRAGWRAGLDPSPMFSTSRYLQTYPDVAAAGMNPLVHYIQFGHAEGRVAWPVHCGSMVRKTLLF